MQFLAVMRILPSVGKDKVEAFNKQETLKTWEFYKSGKLRNIWFIPGTPMPEGTVALLECSDAAEAKILCMEFPFLSNDVAGLDLIPMTPGTFYEMLFDQKYKSGPEPGPFYEPPGLSQR